MAKRRGNGEGSITKRKDGRWQGYVTVGYDVETGKPKKKYFYGKTRKEVQEKITETTGRVQTGTYREPSKLRVSEWFNIWVEEYQKPSLRPTTWESYKMQVDKHIIPALGHLFLTQLQTHHLQALYNDKQKDGARLDGKPGPLSPRSVRYLHMIIHACLEQARREGKIMINPADMARPPKDKKKEIQYLDTEGVAKFLAAARESRHFPAYFLELATGLRRGELLGLRWKDVDLKAGTVTVNQGLVRTKQGLVFQEPKTPLANRTINIPPEIVNELKFHRRRQMTEIENAGEAWENNGLVFCNELGHPLCPRGFTRNFERVLKRAGIENVNFHGLRHTYAVMSLQEGVDIKTTQENMGHHKAAFTLDVYSGVTSKMKKEATDKIGNLLASCMRK